MRKAILKLSHIGAFDLFAQDLDEAEKAIVYATQGPDQWGGA